MRRMVFAVAAAALGGCGGSPVDYAPNFAGTWSGTVTATDVGTGQTVGPYNAEALFIITSLNALRFEACVMRYGPTVYASSATQFASTTAFACPSEPVTGCTAVIATYNTLSGTLAGTTLQFTTNVTLTGCGVTETLNLAFADGVKLD